MKVFHIQKPSGVRTIYAPSRAERVALRALLPELEDIQKKVCLSRVVHGFVKGRSPVTNAMAHQGRRYTLCMDLSSFFDTVDRAKLEWAVPPALLDKILVDGAARQGLPTSPAAANIAAARMDTQIDRWCKRQGRSVVYTRYADDLTISANERATIDQALVDIPPIIERWGFTIAHHKTHVYCADSGRRMVTGVAVDDHLHPTRAAKRRLRAARHQGRNRQADGLAEWCELKLPKGMQRKRHRHVRRTQRQGSAASPPQTPRRIIRRRSKETP